MKRKSFPTISLLTGTSVDLFIVPEIAILIVLLSLPAWSSVLTERNIMRTKFFRWLGSTVLLAILFTCNPARAQSFRVAHTSQGFTSFHYAVINNAGVVCFSATKINASGHVVVGVYKGSSGGVTTVLESEIPAPTGQLVPRGN